jgi:anti-sigma B factor antagonist
VETHTHRGWTIVSVGGELDLYTAPQLREAVARVLNGDGPRIAIDLTDVGFIDSSGLGVIVSSLTKARDQGGDLALVAPPASSLTKLLTLIGLDSTLPTRASLDDLPDA